MARGQRVVGLLLLAPAFLACSYESLSVEETDVVVTIEDEGRDYKKLKTYALTDEVQDLCDLDAQDGPLGGRGGIEDCFPVSHRLDDEILEAIERNMDELGFTKVDRDEADTVLVVGSVARDNWYYSYGYWWCDPYYSYYSCWYPPVAYLYNFPTATIIVNMLAPKEEVDNKAKSAWFAAISGLYETSSDVSSEERATRAIDKAFRQSPYLGGNR